MNIELITKQLSELQQITETWNNESAISIIERDIALDKVKQLYEELRFGSAEVAHCNTPIVEDDEPIDPFTEENEEPEVEVEITYFEGDDEPEEEEEDTFEAEETEETEETEEIGEIEEIEVAIAPEREEELTDESLVSISLEDISIVGELDEKSEVVEPKVTEAKSVVEPEIVAEIENTPSPKRNMDNALFDINEIPIRTKKRRSAIMSLYNDGIAHTMQQPAAKEVAPVEPTPKEEPKIEDPIMELPEVEEEQIIEELQIEELTIEEFTTEEPETEELEIEELEIEELEIEEVTTPEPEPQQPEEEKEEEELRPIETTIAESLGGNIETIGDHYASAQNSVDIANGAPTLESLNDRYLISHELFNDDMASCEDMLAELADIDNFDDAMIYIIENYEWDPESEATKLIIRHLEYKHQMN